MTERHCPEFLAFQRNYVVLLNLRHGIDSITSKAFAAEIINSDLKNRCTDKRLSDKERTTCLLDALGEKMPYLPETLPKFAKILNETSSFEYIANMLLSSLEAAKKELKMHQTRVHSRLSPHTAAKLPGGTELTSLSEAKLQLLRMKKAGRIYTTPTAARLPGKSNLITGATHHPGNSSMTTAATYPGNLNTAAGLRHAKDSRKDSLRINMDGNTFIPFNMQEEEGWGATATTPPPTPTQRPILERRISRTPPPTLSSHKQLTLEAEARRRDTSSSKQAEGGQENVVDKGDIFTHTVTKQVVEVVVQEAMPTHPAHQERRQQRRRRSLKSQSSIELTPRPGSAGRRGSLDPQDCRIARASSICSVTSEESEYYTPHGSLSEEDFVKPDPAEGGKSEEVNIEEPNQQMKKRVIGGGGSKESGLQERPSYCHKCMKLRRQLSNSEDEVRKLKQQLTSRDERREAQVTVLKEEIFQREAVHMETLDEYSQYIVELEEKVKFLKLTVEKEQLSKEDALKCAEHLLHIITNSSSQAPPCSPLHSHAPYHAPFRAHTDSPMYFEDHAHHRLSSMHHSPAPLHGRDHTHQMTQGGFPLAQSTARVNPMHLRAELDQLWNRESATPSQSCEGWGGEGRGQQQEQQGETGHAPSNRDLPQESTTTIHISQANEFV